MTVATTGGDSAAPWGDLGDVGLEDVSASDIQMPRIYVMGEKAVFKNSATGEEIDRLECVVLGLIKQRIMWDTEVDDNDRPQCKSPDFKVGYPQMRTDIPARKQFPWAKSNFDPANYPPNDEGLVALPCDACKFKDWGKDTKPLCAEQFSMALFYQDANGQMQPGIISFQRSGAKPARTYAGTFRAARQPMFTVYTVISLRPESRGKVNYAVPIFSRGTATDRDSWQGFADSYRQVRDWLHQPPRVRSDDDEGDSTTPAKTSKPAPASARAATRIEDDDPWAGAAPAASASAPAAATSLADDELPF